MWLGNLKKEGLKNNNNNKREKKAETIKKKSQNPNGNIPDWSLPKTLVEEMWNVWERKEKQTKKPAMG